MARDYDSVMDIAKKDYQQKELERLGLTPDEEQHEQLVKFFTIIYDEMKNDTIVPNSMKNKVFLEYFCDSIQLLLLLGFKHNATYLDVSAGIGFPSIPTAIFRPDIKMILVEEDEDKRAFLQEVVEYLELKNVKIKASLSEVNGKFDNAVQRGANTLQDFTRKAKDFVDVNGRLYTFRTENFEQELSEITMDKENEGVQVNEIAEYDIANQIYGKNLVAFELI